MACPVDPLVEAIGRHQRLADLYNASQREEDETSEASALDEGWTQLCASPPAPASLEGALAGVGFVIEELERACESEANAAVLRVCLNYLQSEAATIVDAQRKVARKARRAA